MTKEEIMNMLLVMHDMTKQACNNAVFVEIPTYLKNHCPNIEPEYIEAFRDVILPLSRYNERVNTSMPRYLIIGNKLFQHIVTCETGPIKRPNNLYILRRASSGGIDLEYDLFTYEDLISKGAKPPYDDNELLKAFA